MLAEIRDGVCRHLATYHPDPTPGALLWTTRLDSDDTLAPHYVARLDAALRHTAIPEAGAYFYFPLGQQYVVAQASYRAYLYTRNAFGTYVERRGAGPPRTVMFAQHTRMIDHESVVAVDGERSGWCMVIHDDNVSNDAHGTLVTVPGFRLPAPDKPLASGVRAPVSRDCAPRRAAPPHSRLLEEARMSNDLSHPAETAPQSPALEIVTPLSTRLLFWRARHLKSSPLLHHLPFLFWLIEACRPRSVVALGVGQGVGYFAACQAVDKLDLDARCYGIDTWPDQDTARIPETLRSYNGEQYAEFSQLIQADPREKVRSFPDASIDLLLIDMPADETLLDSLIHDWTRKLSRRGVVLLHGVHGHFASDPARRFLERIIDSYPTVMLEAGEGLVAVLYGSERADRLARLAALSPGAPGHGEVHRVFERLGAAHYFEWASRAEAGRAGALRKKHETAEKTLKQSEQARAALETKLAERDAAYDERSAQIAELQSRLFDLQQAHEARGTELETLRRSFEEERETHAAALAKRDAALAESRQQLESRTAALATESQKLEARFQEIATLTGMVERHEKRVRELEEELQATRAHRDALLNSTFWKLTAPARRTVDTMRALRG